MATALKPKKIKQPRSGIGSAEETNRLLGGDYFDTKSGTQLKPFTPTPVKKPVSILSTDNAIKNLEKGLTTLNQLSPTTAPGYVAPPPLPEQAPLKIPKAYFTNEAGQEAEFDEKQLTDSKNQKFLQDGGYVQTKTEGPNYDPASKLKSNVKDINSKFEDLTNEFLTFDLDKDPAFQGIAGNIVKQYAELRRQTEAANVQRAGSLQTLGFRTGTTQYAGAVQMGLQGEELRQANARISEVIAKEATAISEAREAYRTGKYANFTSKLAAVEKLRKQKTDELTEYNTKLADITKRVREETNQSERDSAIATLLSQGITDPIEIYKTLKDAGGKYTAEEVTKTMKALAPEGNIEKLSGDIRDYFILKENDSLPANITALPEGEQLTAWIQFMKPPKVLGGGVKNKMTIAEAKSNNLPLAVVGMSEDEILGSMYESTPPQWFIDKLSQEKKMSIGPDQATQAWEEYRQAFIKDFESDSDEYETKDVMGQTKKYFLSLYGDALDDETAQTLADYVQLYVDGGMSYKEAIEKVQEEAE